MLPKSCVVWIITREDVNWREVGCVLLMVFRRTSQPCGSCAQSRLSLEGWVLRGKQRIKN